MSNQNNRTGASDASSNEPADEGRRQKTGGNMGAGKSGDESMGAEKPSVRDNMGSRQAHPENSKKKDK